MEKLPKKVTSIKKPKTDSELLPDYMNFWQKNGVTYRPHFPFKPKLQISFLETLENNELVYSNNIFDIPFNFVRDFTITTYPFPKARLNLADTNFHYIEEFALSALAVYNAVMERIGRGMINDPFETVGFCQIRWGWEADPEPIMSDWITLTLVDFQYNITGTWLEIGLELISGAQNFFSTKRLDKKAAPITKKEVGDKAPLYKFVEAMLARFNLRNGTHYIIPHGQFSYELTIEEYNAAAAQYIKKDTLLDDYIRESLSLQFRDRTSRERYTLESYFVPNEDVNSLHKQIKKWELVEKDITKSQQEKSAARVYYWRDHPTSVIQSISANIPRGYFLGYGNLRFVGYTIDPNGNIAKEYVVLLNRKGVPVKYTLSDIDKIKKQTVTAQSMFVQEHSTGDSKLDKRIQNLSQTAKKLSKTAHKKITAKSMPSYKKYEQIIQNKNPYLRRLGVTVTKTANGEIVINAPTPELRDKTKQMIETLEQNISKELSAAKKQQEQIRKKYKLASEQLEENIDDIIRNNITFIPVNLTTGEEVDDGSLDVNQDIHMRNKFILEQLMNRIQQDVVLKLNVTIMGDPWLDGSHVDFPNDRVRIIVKRPDGKDSILTNDYFFLPEVTHTINQSGYTTSMTLMTDREQTAKKIQAG